MQRNHGVCVSSPATLLYRNCPGEVQPDWLFDSPIAPTSLPHTLYAYIYFNVLKRTENIKAVSFTNKAFSVSHSPSFMYMELKLPCISQCVNVFSCVCAIQAYLFNELSDHWCDKEISFSACLIASIMLDCLSRCQVIAPMTPRITQMTSCQRDALYWRAEILAPHRQLWTGRAFITTLPVHFLSLMV